jgi:hypothetical protein
VYRGKNGSHLDARQRPDHPRSVAVLHVLREWLRCRVPDRVGRQMTLYQVAQELARRLANIFLLDHDGRRPVYGGTKKFQEDPHWRNCISFYEHFHGDNGAGLGASHQTGWSGLIAGTMHLLATTTPEQALELRKVATVASVLETA